MPSDCLQRTLMLLTQRDHSVRELNNKLSAKGFDANEIEEAIHKCQEYGYQSDERFAQSFINARIQKGYGKGQRQNHVHAPPASDKKSF